MLGSIFVLSNYLHCRFMEKYSAVKHGKEPDLSDYKEFKLKEDNVGESTIQFFLQFTGTIGHLFWKDKLE